jgi:Ca2+-dependent lipid-binding protein
MDLNRMHDEALANASSGANALDSAMKCSASRGQNEKDTISKYEKKQDEDRLRGALASIFENLISKSGNDTAQGWRADTTLFEAVHFFYYKYYSTSPIVYILLGLMAFFTATSTFYLFSVVFTIIAALMLSASNTRVFFFYYTKHYRVEAKLKELVYNELYKNQISLLNVLKLCVLITAFSFIFIKWQVAIFGFNFYGGYNQDLELYGLLNMTACFVVAYAKLSERWAD